MANVTEVIVRIADIKEFQLLVWELVALADKMRVEACPHAEALESAIKRFPLQKRRDEGQE